MKTYDVVPGLEFDPKHDLEQSPAWFLDLYTHAMVRRSALGLGRRFRRVEIIPGLLKAIGLGPSLIMKEFFEDPEASEGYPLLLTTVLTGMSGSDAASGRTVFSAKMGKYSPSANPSTGKYFEEEKQ